MKELLRRLENVTDEFNQEKLDHARESHFNRDVQLREIQLQNDIRKYKALMVRPPHVCAHTPNAAAGARSLRFSPH